MHRPGICDPAIGACPPETPRPLGAHSGDPAAGPPNPEFRIPPFDDFGFHFDGVDPATCELANYGCASALCIGGTCMRGPAIHATVGHETEHCWGDARFYFPGLGASCYTVTCHPDGSGDRNGLGTHDDVCGAADTAAAAAGCAREERCVFPPVSPSTAADFNHYAGPELPVGCLTDRCVIPGATGAAACLRNGAGDDCLTCQPAIHANNWTAAPNGTVCTFAPDIFGTCVGTTGGTASACLIGDICAGPLGITMTSPGTRVVTVDTCPLLNDYHLDCGTTVGRDVVLAAGASSPTSYRIDVPAGWIVQQLSAPLASPAACSIVAGTCGPAAGQTIDASRRALFVVEKADGTCGTVDITVTRTD